MSWRLDTRRTFFIVFIFLVELGAKNCFHSTLVTADPLFGKTDPFIVKTGQAATLEGSGTNSVGTTDLSSNSTTKTTGRNDGSQKLNTTNLDKPSKIKVVKEKTLVIPDRSPTNFTSSQIKEENLNEEEESTIRPGQGDFDAKALQRTIIVVAGIAVIVVAYLGIKFVLLKRRKVVKRYGRVEASEMDLLDEVEDEDDSDEEEELFDINEQRR